MEIKFGALNRVVFGPQYFYYFCKSSETLALTLLVFCLGSTHFHAANVRYYKYFLYLSYRGSFSVYTMDRTESYLLNKPCREFVGF